MNSGLTALTLTTVYLLQTRATMASNLFKETFKERKVIAVNKNASDPLYNLSI